MVISWLVPSGILDIFHVALRIRIECCSWPAGLAEGKKCFCLPLARLLLPIPSFQWEIEPREEVGVRYRSWRFHLRLNLLWVGGETFIISAIPRQKHPRSSSFSKGFAPTRSGRGRRGSLIPCVEFYTRSWVGALELPLGRFGLVRCHAGGAIKGVTTIAVKFCLPYIWYLSHLGANSAKIF